MHAGTSASTPVQDSQEIEPSKAASQESEGTLAAAKSLAAILRDSGSNSKEEVEEVEIDVQSPRRSKRKKKQTNHFEPTLDTTPTTKRTRSQGQTSTKRGQGSTADTVDLTQEDAQPEQTPKPKKNKSPSQKRPSSKKNEDNRSICDDENGWSVHW